MDKFNIDLSLMRELTEIMGRSLTFKDVETIGSDMFTKYSTHNIENVVDTVSISPLNASKSLVTECEGKKKLEQLVSIVLQLDGNLLNGRIVDVKGLDNFLYRLTKSGICFDYNKRKLVSIDREKEHLKNWGVLRDGKEYYVVVASVDICGNSKLVKKHKSKVMEKVYYKLWEHLRHQLDRYEGRIWSWAGDGGILAFRDTGDITQSVCCCQEILFTLPIFNLLPSKPIKDDIVLRIGMDYGKIKYFEDTGRIVSDVINYAAHLEKKGTDPNGFSISDTIYKRIPSSNKKLFTRQHEFEGRTAYSLVFDVKKAIS